MTIRTIHLEHLTRVEGQGGVTVSIRDHAVEEVRLKLYEPPRYFEEILQGRMAHEAIDMTARICGICPVAYQITAASALEQGLESSLSLGTRALRRLLYCGEWIESHALHVFLLHLPDFFGLPDVAALARVHPEIIQAGLRIKKIGNTIVSTLGGREIHPVNVTLGGFYRPPDPARLSALAPQIESALTDWEMVRETLQTLTIPAFERSYTWVSLRDDQSYPLAYGSVEMGRGGPFERSEARVVCSDGWAVPVYEFEEAITEFQKEGSHARYSRLKTGVSYLCGPMARLALNYDLLDEEVQREARYLGVAGGTFNPFKSLLVRSLEIYLALREAQRIVTLWTTVLEREREGGGGGGGEGRGEVENTKTWTVPAGTYRAATEAPRGLLYHRYDIASDGLIRAVRLIPPTAQNQATMEEDLRTMVEEHQDAADAEIESLCERVVRNHDPCISCAAHFLRVTRVEDGTSQSQRGVQ